MVSYQVKSGSRDLSVFPVDDFDAVADVAEVVGQQDVVLPKLSVDHGRQLVGSGPAKSAQKSGEVHRLEFLELQSK